MALRATVFKADLQIADLDRSYYANHSLTLARHPSETDERMMVRVLAFILNAKESLEFGRGISSDDEPALWDKDLTGRILNWIEVGQPDERVLRRACGRADKVCLYVYGRSAELWWSQNVAALSKQAKLHAAMIAADESAALAALVTRNMTLQCTVQEGQVFIVGDAGTAQVEPRALLPKE